MDTNKHLKPFAALAALSLAGASFAAGSSVLYDFESGVPAGTTILGNTAVTAADGLGGTGGLVITPGANSQNGTSSITSMTRKSFSYLERFPDQFSH